MLLALSLGLVPNQLGDAFGTVTVLVRHQGTPLPFSIAVRTRDSRNQPWEYIERIQYFPKRLLTSPIGRKVTVRVPVGLKSSSQVCAVHEPEPVAGQSSQVLFSLESCANLPGRNVLGSDSSIKPLILTAPGWNSLRQKATPADTHSQNART